MRIRVAKLYLLRCLIWYKDQRYCFVVMLTYVEGARDLFMKKVQGSFIDIGLKVWPKRQKVLFCFIVMLEEIHYGH